MMFIIIISFIIFIIIIILFLFISILLIFLFPLMALLFEANISANKISSINGVWQGSHNSQKNN